MSLWAEATAAVLGDADWAIAWRPGDYEIGRWDGPRLRQMARVARRPSAGGESR